MSEGGLLGLLQKAIVVAVQHQRVAAHIDVVSSCLVVYDILLNLDTEIQHIWQARWSIFKVLYLIQRYLPLFDTAGVMLHHNFTSRISPEACFTDARIAGWCFIGGIVISELVLSFRILAVWRNSKIITALLTVFLLGCWIPGFYFLNEWLNSLEFVSHPIRDQRGCFVAGGSNIIYMCWVMMMVFDTGALVLIAIPGFKAYRAGGRSEILKAVYQDGIIYYSYLFLFSVTNVVVCLTLPRDMVHVMASLERVIHSILTSHIVLHIREVASRNVNTAGGIPLSPSSYHSRQGSSGITSKQSYVAWPN